jgi:hypothetical protein
MNTKKAEGFCDFDLRDNSLLVIYSVLFALGASLGLVGAVLSYNRGVRALPSQPRTLVRSSVLCALCVVGIVLWPLGIAAGGLAIVLVYSHDQPARLESRPQT